MIIGQIEKKCTKTSFVLFYYAYVNNFVGILNLKIPIDDIIAFATNISRSPSQTVL